MFTQQKFTKAEALATFKENELPQLIEMESQYKVGRHSVDSILRRTAWNDYTDMLCKGGQITQSQYNRWSNPF
jgi:hypothetical protein